MSNVLCLKRLFLPSHLSFCSPALYQLCLSPRLRQCILSTCITSVSSNLRICDLYNSPDSYFQLSLGYNHFDSQTWHLYNCSQKHGISPNIQKSIFLAPGTFFYLSPNPISRVLTYSFKVTIKTLPFQNIWRCLISYHET